MPDQLRMSPDGLVAASATLRQHAGELVPSHHAVSAGGKASSVGTARVASAIAAFSAAYAGRLADHALSSEVAAVSYNNVDDQGATEIRSASM